MQLTNQLTTWRDGQYTREIFVFVWSSVVVIDHIQSIWLCSNHISLPCVPNASHSPIDESHFSVIRHLKVNNKLLISQTAIISIVFIHNTWCINTSNHYWRPVQLAVSNRFDIVPLIRSEYITFTWFTYTCVLAVRLRIENHKPWVRVPCWIRLPVKSRSIIV